MSYSADDNGKDLKTMFKQVLDFVEGSSGLNTKGAVSESVKIEQKMDKKSILLKSEDIQEVLNRTDSEGQSFLQVNFSGGLKILLTDQLVGFKPNQNCGVDMEKLPKVVTTPDVLSVFEAIKEALEGDDSAADVDLLKRVFVAVLRGAESVGFDIRKEKKWLDRLCISVPAASA